MLESWCARLNLSPCNPMLLQEAMVYILKLLYI